MDLEKLKQLANKCWGLYEEFLLNNVINNTLRTKDMPRAMPVLFFGDYQKYISSNIKIITVAINPSKIEFPADSPFLRFPSMEGQNTEKNNRFIERYLDSLKNYYYINPYMKWFNNYNQVLSGMNSGYGDDKKNTPENYALHTDLYSPFPTDPVWRGLDKEQRKLLIHQGIQLWRELVDILEPDLILMSTAQDMTDQLGFDFISNWETIHTIPEKANGELRAKPYVIQKRKLKLSNDKEVQLYYGYAGVTPFQYINNKKKREAGEIILNSFQEGSSKSFVQFTHPGGEHKPSKNKDMFPWNIKEHKRKFMKNPGKYITSLDQGVSERADLIFWGEWEAQSKVIKRFNGENGPKSLFEPSYEIPGNYAGKQNTDPCVFGDNFYYTCCRQYKRVSNGNLTPTKMTRLQFGDVILFGSNLGGKFVLDTVFVVDRNPIVHNRDSIGDIAGELPKTYSDVTIAPLYPDLFSKSALTNDLDTSKSCLVDFESEEADEITQEFEGFDKLNFYLYKGVTYENRNQANGMFSFFPCSPYRDENTGFERPVIDIREFITPNLAMGFKVSEVDQDKIKSLWESVVQQVLKKGLVLGIQTDFPKMTGKMEQEESAFPPMDQASPVSGHAFEQACTLFNNRDDIIDQYQSYKFFKNKKEYWFAPISFRNSIPPLNPPYINKVSPWKSCYAFSYFFYKLESKLCLKLELGPYKPEERSRKELLNFLHDKDQVGDKRFQIKRQALINENGQFSMLLKEEIEINNWGNIDEISSKMQVLLDRIEFKSLNEYLIKIYKEFNEKSITVKSI